MEAGQVRAVGALRSFRSTRKLPAENRQETQVASIEEREKWSEYYVERETAVVRQRVQDPETATMQELNDFTAAENVGLTTGKPETISEEMLNAIGDRMRNLASFKNEQDGKDEEDGEEDTEHSKLSHDGEPGWVMGTISKTVQHHMESFCQRQMTIDVLTQPGWGDAANDVHERDMMYVTAELKVQAVVKLQMDTSAATPSPTTIGEYMQTVHIVREKLQMPAVTS
jgi:hypothetical protein